VLLLIVMYMLLNLTTERAIVDGMSMEATLYTGQLLLVSRLHYWIDEPERGDLVVFHLATYPEREFIKRIIGLPGETVELRDSRVYINGQLRDEPYLNEPCLPTVCPNSIWQVSVNEYFVMGDNRNHSQDSRSYGTIPQTAIIGKAVLRYYPLSEMQWLDQNGENQ
jgi:signal peptidase I